MADQLTDYILVFGPPAKDGDTSDRFQSRMRASAAVDKDAWQRQQEDDLRRICTRCGNLAHHTLLESLLTAATGCETLVLDHEVLMRGDDDDEYHPAVILCSDDIRFEHKGVSLESANVKASVNAAMTLISALLSREWVRWAVYDQQMDESADKLNAVMYSITEQLLPDMLMSQEDSPLASTLISAISKGRSCARDELEWLWEDIQHCRRHSPLRDEWRNIVARALAVANCDIKAMKRTVSDEGTRLAAAFIYLEKERTDALIATPELTIESLGEIGIKAFLTSFALERMAPDVSRELCELMLAQ